jgi:hypothetical protein
MRTDFELKWRVAPTPLQMDGMIQQAVDNELLYQEANRLRLGAGDPSVRLRLIQKMRAVSASSTQDGQSLYRQALELGLDNDVVIRGILVHKMVLLLQQDARPAPITDEELMAYVQRHRTRFLQPATVTFSQVFLSATAHATGLDQQARTLVARLRSRSFPPQTAVAFSDPFPLAADLRGQSRARLGRFFGKGFAAAVFEAPRQSWTGPIASPFGLHLIWVSAKTIEQLLPLDGIRLTVTYEIQQERAQLCYARAMERLRALYTVHIERDDSSMVGGASAKDNRS